MKKSLIPALLLLSAIILSASALLPIYGEEELYDKVVRLHVIANSDSEEDQNLKLAVRDSVLSEIGGELSECTSREEAAEKILYLTDRIESAAKSVIANNGCAYPVSVSLGEEYYPEKEYEEITMPSGKYLSLQVKIGAAEGRNWWCVAFPPLCLSAAENKQTDNEDALIRAGFTGEQYRVITNTDSPKYKIKFKILEILGEWLRKK